MAVATGKTASHGSLSIGACSIDPIEVTFSPHTAQPGIAALVVFEFSWMEYDVTSDLLAGTAECTQPLSSMERAVAALWSEVLQTSRLPGPSDNFFALGGNSMTMVMLEYRIQEELAIELPSGALLGAPTLREISELLEAESAATDSENAFMETGTTGA